MIELDIVRYNSTVPTRWKNGLGEARQVATWPADAALFSWQASIARMTGKLPFSDYPGIDRSLCIIGGDGLIITSPHRELVLDGASKPFHFPGEEAIVGETIGTAEMVDFNILTRRGVLEHQTERLEVSAGGILRIVRDFLVIFSQNGTIGISCGDAAGEIGTRDAAVLRDAQGLKCYLSSSAGAICLLADIAFIQEQIDKD